MLKILHPSDAPTDDEFDEYAAYAIECRRRVKEQMNKRKPDDEFARIDLSFVNREGKEVIVICPESVGASATLEPARRGIRPKAVASTRQTRPVASVKALPSAEVIEPVDLPTLQFSREGLVERHYTIAYGDTGHSYDTIFGPYLPGAKSVVVEDPYIRLPHQIANFVRFCETSVKTDTVRKISLVTSYDQQTDMAALKEKLDELKQSLLEYDVSLDVRFDSRLHDREVQLDNGWTIKIGRGLDFYQKPDGWYAVGATDLSLRRCLETKVDVFRP
jgi:ATP-dependent Lon protease